MKTRTLLAALAVLGMSLTNGFAQSNPEATPSESATVYVYRSSALMSSARKYGVYANGKLLCKIGNKRHCQVSLPIGPVTFTTKLAGLTLVPKKRPRLELTLEAGKTYYLQADLKTKLFPLQAVLPLTEVVPNPSKLNEIKKSKTEPTLLSSAE
ncbi:hypothetical protein GCM10028803_10260 [Larkinella knui]|uniref:DUF2846 domain-containing protein n=1 Tax=Larkinella knui TaxID=2025310 RepID=A0A3P1CCF3_9BACT|nr:DUF2846 domain-containing protein [Larkinella knui]RRB11001.1 DUF2846 domain-containing protein [Larkinella knui]